jgi:hydrogenase large subunit
MSKRITVAPVTRVEGHLAVNLDVSASGKVVGAWASGTMFRGFESIMVGREPRDAIHLTQRICGVCPVPHARVAVDVVERAFGIEPPRSAVLLRNLVQAAGAISDHILHFYHLALLDYVRGPDFPPFTPAPAADLRFSDAESKVLASHYLAAFDARRKAQEMAAIFGGKLPHVMTFVPGGVTQQPTAENVAEFRRRLAEITAFVENVYIPDAMRLAEVYPDYLEVGAGPANLLSFGAYPDGNGNQLFPAGRWVSGGSRAPRDGGNGEGRDHRRSDHRLFPLTGQDVASIDESVRHAYYGETRRSSDAATPNLDKPGAYSWVKAPRLGNDVYQVGSIARMIIAGNYRGGLSAMDRLLANAHETALVASAMRGWLDGLVVGESAYVAPANLPSAGSAVALSEAPRGALAHWLEFAGGKVTGYRIITPTSWNASPRDEHEVPGPLEQALLGIDVADRAQPIEVYRVIHSFDPCLGCAVYVTAVD